MLLALCGYATCGKDTVGNILAEDYGFVIKGFADPLRKAVETLNPLVHHVNGPEPHGSLHSWVTTEIRYSDALSLHGYNGAKAAYPEVRRVLQVMGTEVGRNLFGENFWVDQAVKGLELNKQSYVFTDCRFPNEADAVRALGGHVVWINRPGVGPLNDHPSETSMDGYFFDFDLWNAGTLEDLRKVVHAVVESLDR